MFDRDDALHLLEYDGWAMTRVDAALIGIVAPPPKAVKLFGHLVASLENWLARVEGRKAAAWWPEAPLDELSRRRVAALARWREYAGSLDARELAREVVFENSAGLPCRDPVEAIVRHVVNHGTYHRGQIASALRDAGHPAPAIDYIVWRRERQRAT